MPDGVENVKSVISVKRAFDGRVFVMWYLLYADSNMKPTSHVLCPDGKWKQIVEGGDIPDECLFSLEECNIHA